MADDVCGHEEPAVLAVPDERHPHHQHLEHHHGNNTGHHVLETKTKALKVHSSPRSTSRIVLNMNITYQGEN